MERLNFSLLLFSEILTSASFFSTNISYRILEEEFNGSRNEYVRTMVCRICYQRKG